MKKIKNNRERTQKKSNMQLQENEMFEVIL